jgi:quercetin dioxygenase-like cupin family protein
VVITDVESHSVTQYFQTTESGTPTREGSWPTPSGVEVHPGLTGFPVVGGDCMLMLYEWEGIFEVPAHAHAEEQLVLVLDGEIEFVMGGEKRIMRAGDAVVVPPWVEHGASSRTERVRTVDAFAPVRQALLQLLAERASH